MHYQRWRKFGAPEPLPAHPGNWHERPAITERICRECGFVGEPSLFKKGANICKPCATAYKEEWKQKNPDRWQAILARSAATRQRYELRRRAMRNGQDPDLIEEYCEQHDGKCEICSRKPNEGEKSLAIDHDHKSGIFRGLLCDSCNNGLGRFQDDPELLLAAVMYLERGISWLTTA